VKRREGDRTEWEYNFGKSRSHGLFRIIQRWYRLDFRGGRQKIFQVFYKV
jgi:hypothetical protein